MTNQFCINCLKFMTMESVKDYPYKKRILEEGKKTTIFFCSNKCMNEHTKLNERYKVLGIK